jgi:hypothetical protein
MKAFALKLSIMLEKVFGRTIIAPSKKPNDQQLVFNFDCRGRNTPLQEINPPLHLENIICPSLNSWVAKVTIRIWHSPSLGSKIPSREHQI